MAGLTFSIGGALLGILMLETTFQRIPGDVGNPTTFPFPVSYRVVPGASPDRVMLQGDPGLIEPFVDAGKCLIQQGVRALGTSCGFLALFHRELNEALDVPVYTTSLLQVPLARSVIRSDQKVGILTARKQSLTPRHLSAVGIDPADVVIAGMDDSPEFSGAFVRGKPTLDREACSEEMGQVAGCLVRSDPDIGAVVMECTNMPPYRNAVRYAVGKLPVFDVVTMLTYAHETLLPFHAELPDGEKRIPV